MFRILAPLKTVFITIGMLSLSSPVPIAHALAPAQFSKPKAITCDITKEENVFFLVADKVMKFDSAYLPMTQEQLDVSWKKELYAIDTKDGYIPICSFLKTTENKKLKLKKALGIKEFIWQEDPDIAKNLVQVILNTGENIKDSIANSELPINNRLWMRTYKGQLVNNDQSNEELPVKNGENKNSRYSINYQIHEKGFPTEYYTVTFVSKPLNNRNMKPQNRLFPSLISCYSQNIKDPLQSWVEDGDLRNWERCQIQFTYFTDQRSHAVPINVFAPGRMLKTTPQGIYPDTLIKRVSNFLDSSISKFENVEALEYFKRQALRQETQALESNLWGKNRFISSTVISSSGSGVRAEAKWSSWIKNNNQNLDGNQILRQLLQESRKKNISHNMAHSKLVSLIEGGVSLSETEPSLSCGVASLYPAPTVKLLLDNGLPFEADNHINSGLRCAARARPAPNYDVIELLLQYGHDPYVRDDRRKTFIQYLDPHHQEHFKRWLGDINLDKKKLEPIVEKPKTDNHTFSYITKPIEVNDTIPEGLPSEFIGIYVPCWTYYDIMAERSEDLRKKLLYEYESKAAEYLIVSSQLLFPQEISTEQIKQIYEASKTKLLKEDKLSSTPKECLDFIPLQEEVLMKKREELHKVDGQ